MDIRWKKKNIERLTTYSSKEGLINKANVKSAKKEREKDLSSKVLEIIDRSYHDVLDSQSDLFMSIDSGNKRLHVSEGYCSFFGVTQQEMIGSEIPKLNHFDVPCNKIESFLNSSSKPQQLILLCKVKNAKQEMRWISWGLVNIFDEEGNRIKTFAVGRDISELKEAEKRRIDYVKTLEKIAYMTSHKVRGPITRLLGLLELLKREKVNREEWNLLMKHFNTCTKELDICNRELASFINLNQTKQAEKTSIEYNSLPEFTDPLYLFKRPIY